MYTVFQGVDADVVDSPVERILQRVFLLPYLALHGTQAEVMQSYRLLTGKLQVASCQTAERIQISVLPFGCKECHAEIACADAARNLTVHEMLAVGDQKLLFRFAFQLQIQKAHSFLAEIDQVAVRKRLYRCFLPRKQFHRRQPTKRHRFPHRKFNARVILRLHIFTVIIAKAEAELRRDAFSVVNIVFNFGRLNASSAMQNDLIVLHQLEGQSCLTRHIGLAVLAEVPDLNLQLVLSAAKIGQINAVIQLVPRIVAAAGKCGKRTVEPQGVAAIAGDLQVQRCALLRRKARSKRSIAVFSCLGRRPDTAGVLQLRERNFCHFHHIYLSRSAALFSK